MATAFSQRLQEEEMVCNSYDELYTDDEVITKVIPTYLLAQLDGVSRVLRMVEEIAEEYGDSDLARNMRTTSSVIDGIIDYLTDDQNQYTFNAVAK